MAEENEVIKVVENVDTLFPEIVVNGQSHISDRYVAPLPAQANPVQPAEEEEEDTQPQQTVQGQVVEAVELNSVLHNLKDKALTVDVGSLQQELSALSDLVSTIQGRITEINALIPAQATSENKLADKSFVNSSISTNTANFLGTYTTLADIEAIPNPTNNDYAFLETTDSAGNTLYDRYKYNGTQWLFEYELNNSSFTAEQWATINSGLTSTSVSSAIEALDAQSVGGSGKYISAIEETNGVITATEGTITNTVALDNFNPVTSDAVAREVANMSGMKFPDYKRGNIANWTASASQNTCTLTEDSYVVFTYNTTGNTSSKISGDNGIYDGSTLKVDFNNYISVTSDAGSSTTNKFKVYHFEGYVKAGLKIKVYGNTVYRDSMCQIYGLTT